MRLRKLYALCLVLAICLSALASCGIHHAKEPVSDSSRETDSESSTAGNGSEATKPTIKEKNHVQIIPRLDFIGGIHTMEVKNLQLVSYVN